MEKVRLFADKHEAIEVVKKLREMGHPAADVIDNRDGMYLVSEHDASCNCNMCPFLHDNGLLMS
jgi:hypothetical protein